MEPIITVNEYPIGWEWLDKVPLEDFTWLIEIFSTMTDDTDTYDFATFDKEATKGEPPYPESKSIGIGLILVLFLLVLFLNSSGPNLDTFIPGNPWEHYCKYELHKHPFHTNEKEYNYFLDTFTSTDKYEQIIEIYANPR